MRSPAALAFVLMAGLGLAQTVETGVVLGESGQPILVAAAELAPGADHGKLTGPDLLTVAELRDTSAPLFGAALAYRYELSPRLALRAGPSLTWQGNSPPRFGLFLGVAYRL